MHIFRSFDLPHVTETDHEKLAHFHGDRFACFEWKGHKYPLMEGHSGLLWGVMLNLGFICTIHRARLC